jgi:hypothetical protein
MQAHRDALSQDAIEVSMMPTLNLGTTKYCPHGDGTANDDADERVAPPVQRNSKKSRVDWMKLVARAEGPTTGCGARMGPRRPEPYEIVRHGCSLSIEARSFATDL